MQCRVIWPHLAVRGKSHGFSRVGAGTWGIFLINGGNDPSKLLFVQRRQYSCLLIRDISGISSRPGRAIQMLLEVRRETQETILVARMILGKFIFLSIFNKSQKSAPFEALNSACLSRCERDMRRPVQMRRVPRAFSRVSTGDSDIPSSSEMKDEPVFKLLQGNPALFRVRASRCPLN